MTQTVRVLIVGAGSIGQRHARNLHHLGLPSIEIWDPDQARAKAVASEVGARAITSLEQGLSQGPQAVLICSPPSFHVQQARMALRSGAHLFIEKPLSHTFEGVTALMAEAEVAKRVVQVGYNLRFVPGIQLLKKLLDEGAVGKPLWMHAEFGQYLPDWRPQQDYRLGYNAQRSLGGGIILDASHEIDYVLWLLGQPTEIRAMTGKVSDLEIDVEDCATILLRFESGAQADIHVDCLQHAYNRGCKIIGENGSLEWTFSGPVRHYSVPERRWTEMACPFDSDQMYVAEIRDFLQCVETGAAPRCNLDAAVQTLRVALAAKGEAV